MKENNLMYQSPSFIVFITLVVVLILQTASPAFAREDGESDLLSATCGSTSCYKILGIKSNASVAAIRKTYRDLSQKFHPDKFDKSAMTAKHAKETFQQIARAYEILSDIDKRKNYDNIISDPSIWMRLKTLEKGPQRVKTNWFLVFPVIVCTILFFEWYVWTTHYQQALNQYKARKKTKKRVSSDSMTPPSSPRQKKLEKRKFKESKGNIKDEDSQEILDDEVIIIGSDGQRIMPWTFKDSILFQLATAPYHIAINFKSDVAWFIKYTILRKPYDEKAKEQLTVSALAMTDDQWAAYPAEEREFLISKELWIDENLISYAKSKGKGKPSVSLPRSRMPATASDHEK